MGVRSEVTEKRLLVIANETCAGEALFQTIRERADGAEVLIVAPALTSRLRYWMSDEDAGIAAAGLRLERSVERCGAAGIPARGALGDADPLQALDDAVRLFAPDEVVIATHPGGHSNWLERGLVPQARERYSVPITHVEVDAGRSESHVVDTEVPVRDAPSRERHPRRDLAVLLVAWILAIGGSVLSAVLYAIGVGGWVLGIWVVVFDLGLKLALAGVLWTLFQRRPRADRLDL